MRLGRDPWLLPSVSPKIEDANSVVVVTIYIKTSSSEKDDVMVQVFRFC